MRPVFTIYLLSIHLSCFLFDFSAAEQSVFENGLSYS